MIGKAYDAQQTWPGQGAVLPEPRQDRVSLGAVSPETYQPKEPPKRTVAEQMNFNEELLSVLHKELQELFGRLQPVMVPVPEEPQVEQEWSELNSHIVTRLINESGRIQHMIDNVRQVQRDLQL